MRVMHTPIPVFEEERCRIQLVGWKCAHCGLVETEHRTQQHRGTFSPDVDEMFEALPEASVAVAN